MVNNRKRMFKVEVFKALVPSISFSKCLRTMRVLTSTLGSVVLPIVEVLEALR